LFQHNSPIEGASQIWNEGMNMDNMELNELSGFGDKCQGSNAKMLTA